MSLNKPLSGGCWTSWCAHLLNSRTLRVWFGLMLIKQRTSRLAVEQVSNKYFCHCFWYSRFGMTGAFVVPLLIVEEKEKQTLDFLFHRRRV